ncbi:fibronectin type III domain-containing protein [Desulfosporosinus hippei]|uniref:Ig-like domain (Group 3) n=1 Tax=Desulfosporosinus hippei DSM 8344 TaxID=1121419 RepID=A0A1G7RXD5_9FIRM|nr:fibronectin type III domain-containing protein [Desulfosporosinus hippei]SDG15344.1 hypothetical protein SAMN05443529_101223 [Desulfosporosinus hippei DSM 8344]
MIKGIKKIMYTALFGLVFALSPVGLVQAADIEPDINMAEDVINAISIGDITSVNGKPSIEVTGLPVGATVKIYDQASDGKLLGSATVKTGQTSAIISLSNISTDVYVSVTLESARSVVTMKATEELEPESITVDNNAGAADIVTVSDLEVGDIIKVYDQAGTKLLGKATVSKGKTETTVSIPQLGSDEGEITVSVTRLGNKESDKCTKAYDEESYTYELAEHNITIVNNAGITDTVTVTDDEESSILEVGDIVKVYNHLEKLLGKSTAIKGKNGSVIAVVNIRQLGTDEGEVQVSVTSKGKRESEKCEKYFPEETGSKEPSEITVQNNLRKNDKVIVSELNVGDIVKVYSSASGGKLLGKATVATGKDEASVTIRQLSGGGAGSVWVSVTSRGAQESERVEQAYDAESELDLPTEIVSDLSFTDTDTDKDQIGGEISWTAPDDVSEVTHYEIYTSTNGTTKGTKLAKVAVGTNTYTIADDTDSTGLTHIAVFTLNSAGIASEGVFEAITDVNE